MEQGRAAINTFLTYRRLAANMGQTSKQSPVILLGDRSLCPEGHPMVNQDVLPTDLCSPRRLMTMAATEHMTLAINAT